MFFTIYYRYIAVHYPLDYSQAMHEANALTIRILKYVSAVVAITCLFTFTKFLEGKVVWIARNDTITNTTVWEPQIDATTLRTNPWYTIYYNWSRLLVLGVIPFVMLVYLNAQIFKDIKARSKRRFNTKAQNTTSQSQVQNISGGREGINTENQDSQKKIGGIRGKLWFRKKDSKRKMTTLQISGDKFAVIDEGSTSMGVTRTDITQLNSDKIEESTKCIATIDEAGMKSMTSEDKTNNGCDKSNSISIMEGSKSTTLDDVPDISTIADSANPLLSEDPNTKSSCNQITLSSDKIQGKLLIAYDDFKMSNSILIQPRYYM